MRKTSLFHLTLGAVAGTVTVELMTESQCRLYAMKGLWNLQNTGKYVVTVILKSPFVFVGDENDEAISSWTPGKLKKHTFTICHDPTAVPSAHLVCAQKKVQLTRVGTVCRRSRGSAVMCQEEGRHWLRASHFLEDCRRLLEVLPHNNGTYPNFPFRPFSLGARSSPSEHEKVSGAL